MRFQPLMATITIVNFTRSLSENSRASSAYTSSGARESASSVSASVHASAARLERVHVHAVGATVQLRRSRLHQSYQVRLNATAAHLAFQLQHGCHQLRGRLSWFQSLLHFQAVRPDGAPFNLKTRQPQRK